MVWAIVTASPITRDIGLDPRAREARRHHLVSLLFCRGLRLRNRARAAHRVRAGMDTAPCD
jgi:hypothetical protein